MEPETLPAISAVTATKSQKENIDTLFHCLGTSVSGQAGAQVIISWHILYKHKELGSSNALSSDLCTYSIYINISYSFTRQLSAINYFAANVLTGPRISACFGI